MIGSIYTQNSELFGTKLMEIAHTLKASKSDVGIVEQIEKPQIEVLGNYMKSNHDATRVVNPDGIAPTVRECHGSVTAVAIKDKNDKNYAQINILGLLDIKGKDQVRRVYGVDGISPTLNTMQGGNKQPKIVEEKEYIPGAIRGRYSTDGSVEQHLEQGNKKYTNTITTVTKDNVLIEKGQQKLEKVGQISSDGSHW